MSRPRSIGFGAAMLLVGCAPAMLESDGITCRSVGEPIPARMSGVRGTWDLWCKVVSRGPNHVRERPRPVAAAASGILTVVPDSGWPPNAPSLACMGCLRGRVRVAFQAMLERPPGGNPTSTFSGFLDENGVLVLYIGGAGPDGGDLHLTGAWGQRGACGRWVQENFSSGDRGVFLIRNHRS